MSEGLRIEGLTVKRGGLSVCRDVDIAVPEGEITLLLGANGAGKSTLLDGIAGLLPAAGAISLGDRHVEALPPHRRAALGLAYVEQGRSVFTRLTVEQNIAVVSHSNRALDRAFELFPRLSERRGVRAGLLSGGEQQMLVIARALATNPKVLMVDELSLGLAPPVTRTLLDALVELAKAGVGILLIEQFAELAREIADSEHVMQRGTIVREN